MIPSHTKVAWAFLDKLLGRKPPPPDRDPRTLSMKERDQILMNSIGRLAGKVEKSLELASHQFAKEIIRASKREGVDPRHVLRRLTVPRKFWPRMQKTHLQWLDLMASALLLVGDMPILGKMKTPPELEPSLAKVLNHLAVWSQKKLKPFFERAYLDTLQTEARNLVPVYDYPGEPDPSLPKLTLALMHEFEWRLDYGRLPVRHSDLMFRLLRLFT